MNEQINCIVWENKNLNIIINVTLDKRFVKNFRYFRQNLTQISPYFMECTLANMTTSMGLSYNKTWEGVLCTCNKDFCNNASSTDLHAMFSKASTTSNLYLYIVIKLFSIYIVISIVDI